MGLVSQPKNLVLPGLRQVAFYLFRERSSDLPMKVLEGPFRVDCRTPDNDPKTDPADAAASDAGVRPSGQDFHHRLDVNLSPIEVVDVVAIVQFVRQVRSPRVGWGINGK